MTGIIFRHTLRRNWLNGLYWAIGIALLGGYIIAVIPNVDMLKQYADLIKTMPPLLLQAFGMDASANIATPAGFLGFGFFGYVLLVLAAYGVIAGLNVTANEEDRGIMDVTLSLPIPRWRLVVERILAYTLLLVLILLITFLTMCGIKQTSTVEIDMGLMAQGIFNLLPSTLLVFAFTVFAGTVLRSRGAAAAVASGFVIVSYFIDFIGKAASDTAAASARVLSFYAYYNGGDVMSKGLDWGSVVLLTVVALALTAASLWCFERRDIGI